MTPIPLDIRLRKRAKNAEAWGFVLMAVAIALWVWFAVLLLVPYDAGGSGTCESRLFTDGPTANAQADFRNPCAAQRDWPELLGILGLSVPVSVAGAVLHTSGVASQRLNEHAAEIARLKELVERRG
ncbi:hypothetical protein AB0O76_29220 [Streptomyces sp. NPDC086554]|uniref:hypothetical protein n=1 Tax=Streptomyces sp. NPDC086554 TaxID=3154864 RepID=UPI00344001E4